MEPTYPLNHIKALFGRGRFIITMTSLQTAALMGFFAEDIVECVSVHLNESHFYKTMPAEKSPGLMQDVYKIRYEEKRVYLKLQLDKSGRAVVISFKEDESTA